MKLAIIHDWLVNMGGAERTILAFNEMYPNAPIYTTVYNQDKLSSEFMKMNVVTSFIQNLPRGKTSYQKYLALMPTAFEQFDLSNYDVVLSSSSSCAKGVITRPETMHVCYCHTPMRYAWDFYHEYMDKEKLGKLSKLIIFFAMNYIRMWDRLSADRVDYYITNSHNVAKRIKKHYRRDVTVIHPPVNASYYTPIDSDDNYYLIVSRLVSYKRIDIAIKAFNKLGLPLKIIGDGPELKMLKSISKSNVEFLGRLSDESTLEYYRKCKAFIFPGEEDFGITPLEAQCCGRPVIAFGKGGALETIVQDKTGVFFSEQTAEALIKAIQIFETKAFNKEEVRRHAQKFDVEIFKKKIKQFIDEKYQEHLKELSYN